MKITKSTSFERKVTPFLETEEQKALFARYGLGSEMLFNMLVAD